MKKTDLAPIDGRKSFYGKAKVFRVDDCDILVSYDTVVCRIYDCGLFVRHWDDYSATTMRHVNAFRADHGLSALSKKRWESCIAVPSDLSYTDLLALSF